MNRSIGCVMLLLLAGLWSSNVFAACNKISCTGLVESLYLDAEELHVQIQGPSRGMVCKLLNNRYISVSHKHPMFGEWHGMLLGAYLANKPATVRVVPDSKAANCQIQLVALDRNPPKVAPARSKRTPIAPRIVRPKK